MSSPIAHCSIAFGLWPVVRRRLDPDLSRRRRIVLGVLLLLALVAPDADVLQGLATGRPMTDYHNGFSHSLLVAAAFAIPFGVVCGLIGRGHWLLFAAAGAAAYGSHVLIDAATWGRGVQMLWPITDQRFSAPVNLFVGVRHSSGAPWWMHVLTLINDGAFALVVWLLSRRRQRRSTGKAAAAGHAGIDADRGAGN